MLFRVLAALSLVAVLGAVTHARADDDASSRAANEVAAAEAYDAGTESYRNRDYAAAAEAFERAYALAPTPEALVQAMRSHGRAGNELRALTLAALVLERYPHDENGDRYARPVLRDLGERYVRVEVSCVGCTLWVDGVRHDSRTLYVEPEADHAVEARFRGWTARATVSGEPGARRALSFDAPTIVDTSEADVPPSRTGWSPVVFWSCVGATAIVGGVTLWSGLDTLAGAAAYETSPTEDGLRDGRRRELRTNVLLGVTAGAAVGTTLIGVFATDWSRGAFSLSAAPLVGGGFLASAAGTLP